jgi:hypothetical protein
VPFNTLPAQVMRLAVGIDVLDDVIGFAIARFTPAGWVI